MKRFSICLQKSKTDVKSKNILNNLGEKSVQFQKASIIATDLM